jgi:hypothetical protein
MGVATSSQKELIYKPPLSGQEAFVALQQAESIDNYRTLVSQSTVNRLARAGQTYLPAIQNPSIAIPPADPDQPWPNGQVLWMSATADGGLPHTRAPHYICLPLNIHTSSLATTMLHERVHISQRTVPKAWQILLKTAWSMTTWFGVLPDEHERRRRINPDLLGAPLYIWKNRWVVFAIFQSLSQPSLPAINVVWWDTTTNTLHREAPEEWTSYFGNLPAGEHPYEIAAYLIAEGDSNTTPAYNDLKQKLSLLSSQD